MKTLYFDSVWSEGKWSKPLYIQVDAHRKILKWSSQKPKTYKTRTTKQWLIPGFVNYHSHAFQFALSGKTERLGKGSQTDDFWTWREAMYRLATQVSPEGLESIATSLYSLMRQHGYLSVVEFHYLHKDPKGKPYRQKTEMSERLIRAAKKAGLQITLVPIYYRQSNFNTPATESQKRFLSKDLSEYMKLVEEIEALKTKYSHLEVGIGVHSLRAVPPNEIIEVAKARNNVRPFHIHVAEQTKEVEDCKSSLGCRPVEWCLENLDLDKNCYLVHATHLNAEETRDLAKSKAVVVLCPSTEANLGDGLFPLADFLKNEGNWKIGTDSHIGLNPFEELRWLDYGQRLQKRIRNPLLSNQSEDSGAILFTHSSIEGPVLQKGKKLSGIVIQANHPRFQQLDETFRLSSLVYCGDVSFIEKTLTLN